MASAWWAITYDIYSRVMLVLFHMQPKQVKSHMLVFTAIKKSRYHHNNLSATRKQLMMKFNSSLSVGRLLLQSNVILATVKLSVFMQ